MHSLLAPVKLKYVLSTETEVLLLMATIGLQLYSTLIHISDILSEIVSKNKNNES